MMNISAAQRTADTLLRVMGGGAVMLRMTTQAATGDAAEVGMGGAIFQDMAMSPALVRKVRPELTPNGAEQYELLVSATAVQVLVASAGAASAQALFDAATGVVIDGEAKSITAVGSSEAFGGAYLFTLKLKDY